MKQKIQDVSRGNLVFKESVEHPSDRMLHTSAMMRIADALEIITVDYIHLQKRNAFLEVENIELKEKLGISKLQIAAQKGVVTKLKKKIT